MPKDMPKPPISVDELLAADDGPKPGIMYLTKTEFGGVKLTENNTVLGAGPDPNEPELPARARKHSAEDLAKAKAVKRAMEARAAGQRLSTSVLDVFRAGYEPEHAPLPSAPPADISTSPRGESGPAPLARRDPRRRGLLLAAGVLVAVAAAIAFVTVPRSGDTPTVSLVAPQALPTREPSPAPTAVKGEPLVASPTASAIRAPAPVGDDEPPSPPAHVMVLPEPRTAPFRRSAAPARAATPAPVQARASDVSAFRAWSESDGSRALPATPTSAASASGEAVAQPPQDIILRDFSPKRIDPR